MEFITEEQRSLVAQLSHFVRHDCNYVDVDTCIAILVSCSWDINDAYVELEHTINNVKLNIKLREQELKELECKELKRKELERNSNNKKFEFEEKINTNRTSNGDFVSSFGKLYNREHVEDTTQEEDTTQVEEHVEDTTKNETKFKYHEGYS